MKMDLPLYKTPLAKDLTGALTPAGRRVAELLKATRPENAAQALADKVADSLTLQDVNVILWENYGEKLDGRRTLVSGVERLNYLMRKICDDDAKERALRVANGDAPVMYEACRDARDQVDHRIAKDVCSLSDFRAGEDYADALRHADALPLAVAVHRLLSDVMARFERGDDLGEVKAYLRASYVGALEDALRFREPRYKICAAVTHRLLLLPDGGPASLSLREIFR